MSGTFLALINDIFIDRKHYVKYNNKFSESMKINSGVHQGGVLSPTLFNIYTSDLCYYLENTLFIFADDILLLRKIYDQNDCLSLQRDLNNLKVYCDVNSLKLNPLKCKCLRITNNTKDNFIYEINGNRLSNVDEAKYLGVIYDRKMLFNKHLDSLIEKALRKYRTLQFVNKRLNGFTFIKLFRTYIQPIYEFCNQYITLTKTQSKKIEMLQRRATRYAWLKIGKIYENYHHRLKEFNMQTCNVRRIKSVLKIIFKIIAIKEIQNSGEICNKYLDIPTEWVNQIELLNNPLQGTFCVFKNTRLIRVKKYTLNYGCHLFNSLPLNARKERNLEKFLNSIDDFSL